MKLRKLLALETAVSIMLLAVLFVGCTPADSLLNSSNENSLQAEQDVQAESTAEDGKYRITLETRSKEGELLEKVVYNNVPLEDTEGEILDKIPTIEKMPGVEKEVVVANKEMYFAATPVR